MEGDVPLSAPAKEAALALSEVQKALRFFRLYPPGHRLCAEAVERTHQRLAGALARHGPFELSVREDGLSLGSEVVLHGSGQSTDLAALLFPCGVEALSLRPGVESEEVEQLVRALAQAGGPEGGDLGVVLWGRALPHVGVRLLDALVEEEDDAFEGEVPAGDMPSGPARLDPQGRAGDPEVALALARRDAELGAAGGAGEDAHDALRGLLREEVARASLLEYAREVVGWITREEELADVDVGRFHVARALQALAAGDLDGAAEAIETLTDAGPLRRRHAALLGAEEALRRLAHALELLAPELGPDGMIERGLRYLTPLGDGGVAGACAIYAATPNGDVRRVFRRYLSSHVGFAADAVAALALVPDEQVAKEAIGILALGGRDSRAWELLRELGEGRAPAPRAALARQVLGRLTGEAQRLRYLVVIREDAQRRRRLAAARRLGELGADDPVVFEQLVQLVLAPELTQRDDEELSELLALLVRLGGVRAVKPLRQLAQRRTLVFGRRDAQRVREAALATLERLQRGELRGPARVPRTLPTPTPTAQAEPAGEGELAHDAPTWRRRLGREPEDVTVRSGGEADLDPADLEGEREDGGRQGEAREPVASPEEEDDQDGAITRVLAVHVAREEVPSLDEDEDDGAITRVLDKPRRGRAHAPEAPVAAEAPAAAGELTGSGGGAAAEREGAAGEGDDPDQVGSDTTHAQELWIERVASSSRSSWVEAWVEEDAEGAAAARPGAEPPPAAGERELPDLDDELDLTEQALDLAERTLAAGDLEGTARIAAGLAEATGGRLSAEASRRLATPELLTEAGRALGRLAGFLGAEAVITLGRALLDLLDDAALPAVCELYPELTDEQVRRVFRRFLSDRASSAADALEPLTRHPRRQIVQEALGMLAMGGPGSRAWALLRELADDATQPARAKLAALVVAKIDRAGGGA